MVRSGPFRISRWALALAPALVLALLPTVAATAAPKASSFTAAITPSTATVGQPTTFTFSFTNDKASTNDLGSVQVVVPAGFSDLSVGTATSPAGWVSSLPSCSSDSPIGCGGGGSTLVQVATPSNSGAQKVGAGHTLSFTITATPGAALSGTSRAWNVAAKNSAAWSTGQLLTFKGTAPTVTVIGAATKLAYGTAPPASVVAGDTFGVTVRILDADDALTASTASVSLSGTSLRGTLTASAVGGVATFSGLSMTKAGAWDVTASSTGLTSAVSSVTVTPGPPHDLDVTADTSVTAGGTLAVGVTVTDEFDNTVDPQVSVSASVDGGAATSKTTVDGAAGFDLTAPTTVGSHYFTITSGSLTSGQVGFTVVAGAPYALTVDSVTDGGGASGLTKDAPFAVAVTARDQYGNPTPYSGPISLTASGGLGNALGSLDTSGASTTTVGATTTFTGVVYTGYGNSITLTAASTGLVSGTKSVDINLFLNVAQGRAGTSTSLMGCADATPDVPVCSTLILPNGAKGQISLSQGVCDPYTDCLTGPQNKALLAQGLADLTGLYTRNKPATIELRCDKTLCGGGGTNSYPILFQDSSGGQFQVAPACPKKGTIGPNQTFCQDFVQNSRDNAGDLVAHILFLDDLKTTFR